MPDREKVIKGIDICLKRFHCGEECPYHDNCGIGCMEQLSEDALALLKDSEPIVRCRDCKHYLKCDYSFENEDDWYCADGERR